MTETHAVAASLHAELERLRAAAHLMGVSIVQCDRDLRYIWVNDQYASMIGRPAEQIAGRSIAEVLGREAFAALEPSFERVLGGERVEYETEVQLEGVGPRLVHAVYMPTRDPSGATDGWIAVVDDVTERRRYERAHAQLAAIVEGSDDAIVGKTLDGIVTSWNEGARRLFGYTAEEMIGQPIHRLLPSDRADDVSRILERIRAGRRVENYETERVRKDGSRIHVSITVSPITHASGKVTGASKIARDVTERRRMEDTLRETLDLLGTLNRTSALVSAELDLAKLVQAATDAATEATGARYGAFFYNVVEAGGEAYTLYALSGASRESFRDFPMPRNTAIFGPTFRGEGVVRLDDVREDPRYGRNAPHRGLPAGHLPVVSYLAVPVVLRGEVLGGLFFGHPEAGVFSERDERLVTGLAAQAAIAMDNARLYAAEQNARADAEASSRAKDDFLSMVSHELRTPLQSILGWVAVLRQGKLPPERAARALETVERSGRLQGKLIDDLLDASRIIGGRLDLDLQPVDLSSVVEAALEAIRPDASAKGVTIDTSPSGEASVEGDPMRLQQVVSNVVGNAVKFTPSGRSVHVALERDGAVVRIVVRDQGAGIDPGFLPHVFEAFSQAHDVRKRTAGGLGLGLAIVKYLVEQHGGRAEAASEGPGLGATFTIELPLAQRTRAASAPPGRDAPPSPRRPQ